MDPTYVEKETKNGIHEEIHETDVSSETLTIDPEMERRCWRKFDFLVMPQLAILILLGYLDRSNIGKLCLPSHPTLICTKKKQIKKYKFSSSHFRVRKKEK